MIVCVVGSVVCALSPEGEGGGLSRHVGLIFGLCLILVTLAPAKQAIKWISELDIEAVIPDASGQEAEYESIFESTYTDAEIDNLKEGIKDVLEQRFGVDPLCVEVSVRFSGEGSDKKLKKVVLTLYGSAIWADTGEIERYLGSNLGCEIVTVIA